jgi:hypothetical protein
VAVGRTVVVVVAGRADDAGATVVAVVAGGDTGGTVADGCGACARTVVPGPAVPPDRAPDGTDVVVLATRGTVDGGVVVGTLGPDASSLTTSEWAIADGGRSVTSAATMDVAVHTTAVDVNVTASQRPAANVRGSCTP